MERYNLSKKEQYAIFGLLRQYLKPVEGKDSFVFTDDYSDLRIANEVAQQFGTVGKLNRLHVARARRDAIGELEAPKKGRGNYSVGADSWGRLGTLERSFNTLCDRLNVPDLKVSVKE